MFSASFLYGNVANPNPCFLHNAFGSNRSNPRSNTYNNVPFLQRQAFSITTCPFYFTSIRESHHILSRANRSGRTAPFLFPRFFGKYSIKFLLNVFNSSITLHYSNHHIISFLCTMFSSTHIRNIEESLTRRLKPTHEWNAFPRPQNLAS